MPIISIAVQKGGSGKTTTAISLAAALHRAGEQVLLVDADPQANLTQALGITGETSKNLYTELKKEMAGETSALAEVIAETASGLPLVPASLELAGAELELVSVYGREQVLSWLLEQVKNQYRYILIDCPPAIGMLTVNALVASDYVLVPLQGEYLPLKGVYSFLHHFHSVKKKLNRKLELLGLLLVKFDERKKMNRQVQQQLAALYPGKLFQSTIRTCIELAKAQEAGTDIFSFRPHTTAGDDYTQLATELQQRIHTYEDSPPGKWENKEIHQ